MITADTMRTLHSKKQRKLKRNELRKIERIIKKRNGSNPMFVEIEPSDFPNLSFDDVVSYFTPLDFYVEKIIPPLIVYAPYYRISWEEK